MKNRRRAVSLTLVGIAAAAVILTVTARRKANRAETVEEISPHYGKIESSISTTGVVEPQNRLEVKPPISGRVEEILVKEGDGVKAGQTLAWMSSTERAALLDAARAQGEESVRYWEEAYKPAPLIAPIEGKVIVRAVEPGQTVTPSTPVLVLSDRLIVKAQVDETDIGGVSPGQPTVITLDAYPAEKIPGTVAHIAYESKVVNNVTIYEVEILPQVVPQVFRSGMSANVSIIEKKKDDVLVIPLSAVRTEGKEDFVLLSGGSGRKPERRPVKLGLANEENVEVISGLGPDDRVLLIMRGYSSSRKDRETSNPLLPFGGRRRRR